MKRNVIIGLVAVLALAVVGAALAAKARQSPPEHTSVKIGGKEVKIAYSAPSVRGRKIFGELVPFGEPWRTGANEATSLVTETDLTVGALPVPKGSYTLFTLPSEAGMLLIVNKQTGQWGTKYDASQDLGRVEMKLDKPAEPVEKLEIALKADGVDKAKLVISWADRAASVELTAK